VGRFVAGLTHTIVVLLLSTITIVTSAYAQIEEAVQLKNEANDLYREGKTGEAVPKAERAVEIFENTAPAGPAFAHSLSFLARLYTSQGRITEAEPLITRALQIVEKTSANYTIARVLDDLSEVYEMQGRMAAAEPLRKRTLELDERTQHWPNISGSLNNLAALYRAQGRLQEAELLYKRAVEIDEKWLPTDHPNAATALNNLAGLYRAQGRLQEAEVLYKRALEMREKLLPAIHPDIAHSLLSLATFYFDRGDWETATQYARRGGDISIEIARRTLPPGQTNIGLTQIIQDGSPFDRLVLAAWRFAEQQPSQRAPLSDETYRAAQWSTQSAAAAALSQMASRFARGEGRLPRLVREQQELLSLWQQLDRQIVASRTLRPEELNSTEGAAPAQRRSDIDRQLLAINARLSEEFPEYAALVFPEPLSIKATQKLLQPDEALLQFAFAGNEAFVWAVTRDASRWARLGDSLAGIRLKVRTLRCGLDKEGEWDWSGTKQRWQARELECMVMSRGSLGMNEPPPFNLTIANELYETLLGPIKETIRGKHLLVVPSDALTSLPFHVLVTNKPSVAAPKDSAKYARAAWLVKRHAITVLPSVANLHSLRTSAANSAATKAYIAFGNPLLSGPDGNDKRAWEVESCPRALTQRIASSRSLKSKMVRRGVTDLDLLRRQSPLPETADELCAVARDLKAAESDVYLGVRASEAKLKALSMAGELKNYRILHFATHGLLAFETHSLAGSLSEPALLMTPPTAASDEDDGLLTASEVARLNLNAEWVILSACNTAGASDTRNAETLSGLARAFFYAGTRALLVSHWYVDSDAAVKLTTNAIAQLRKAPKIGKSEALRRAMLALLNDKSRGPDALKSSHPAVWAPFVVVGEGHL
jgi:CHAT domain-containing protein